MQLSTWQNFKPFANFHFKKNFLNKKKTPFGVFFYVFTYVFVYVKPAYSPSAYPSWESLHRQQLQCLP